LLQPFFIAWHDVKEVVKGKWEAGKICLDISASLSHRWTWRCIVVGLMACNSCWWVQGGMWVLC